MRQSRGLMGLPAPAIGYDGVVQVGMTKIRVSDGVMRVGGRRLNVDEDGTVKDEQDRPVAKVVNGQVQPLQQQPQVQGGGNG